MLLGVYERIVLDNVLPREGSYLTMVLVDALKKCLRLTPAEVAEWEVKELQGGRLAWNSSKAKEVEIEVGEAVTKIVKSALANLDKAGKVTTEQLSLYEKFMQPT